jgi:hypothetical protein
MVRPGSPQVLDFGLSDKNLERNVFMDLLSGFSIQNLKSQIQNLFDDFIRTHQHVRWHRQADLLGGFEVDYEHKLHRLLHCQFGRLARLKSLSTQAVAI